MSRMDAVFAATGAREVADEAAFLDAPWILDPPSRLRFAPPPPPGHRSRDRRWAGLGLSGPGGYYNLGNAIGLSGGIVLSVAAAGGPTGPTLSSGARAAFDYIAGSASAVSVSIAMLIFFWSGGIYRRAWTGGFPPDPRLNRRGDLLSGYGALALGLGLFLIGQPLLAATAGLMHAFGKFGSALRPAGSGSGRWPLPYRSAVLISRVPAMVLLATTLVAALSAPGGPAPTAVAAPGLLLVCYLLWARADLLLFRE